MDRGLLLPGGDGLDDQAFVRRVVDLGYRDVWVGELWGADAFLRLERVADVADDAGASVRLGTAIANVYGRSPATLAQAAATLTDRSGGPVRLGIGPSTRTAVEGLHGRAYDRPVRRLHETAELVRAFTAESGRVAYDGELFEVEGFPALDADVDVYAAALGPAARRATGRVADGWIPHNIPFPDLEAAFETVARAARERGRDPEAITVAPYVPAAVCETEADAREAIRGHVAYYVGSGEGYRKAVGRRFPQAAEEIAAAWRSSDRARARAAVTDAMVDALGVAGTSETAPDRFRDVCELAVVDAPMIVVPARASDETVERTVATLSPARS